MAFNPSKTTDPRRQVGAIVYAKAMHVTNIKECSRRYGSNAKTKEIRGIVTDVVNKRNEKTNRSSTFVCAIFDLDDDTKKRVELNIRSVHSAPTSGSSDPLNMPPPIRYSICKTSTRQLNQPFHPMQVHQQQQATHKSSYKITHRRSRPLQRQQ